jgi:NAD(P)H-dependent FMN reductase
MMTIIAVTGSLDLEFYAMKLVKAIKCHAPESIVFKMLDISRLPYVAESFECALSSNLQKFYAEIETADAFIITTAEYKRSYSPVLRDILVLGLGPDGKSKWAEKLVTIFGCTPYNINTFGGVGLLKKALEALDMEVYYRPDFYLCDATSKFNPDGILTDSDSSSVVEEFWNIFIDCNDPGRIEKRNQINSCPQK